MGSENEFQLLVTGLFDTKWLSNSGRFVQQLEHQIADYLGVRHCVSICNGTVALEIAIRALGLTGEVIVPSYTFIATAHALNWQGVKPVFADINEKTHNIDPESVRSLINPKTSGIIGVHIWGEPSPIRELEEIASENGLKLLFDAGHAFGNTYKGRMIGGFGEAEVLSFHATKFFNTFEGGAVVTNDDELAERVKLMRNFGFNGLDRVVSPGTNGKMTEVCAAMGLVNFDSLDSFVSRNKSNYVAYDEVFSSCKMLNLLEFDTQEERNYQYIVVELNPQAVRHRDRLIDDLHSENVRARKYFWPGCHMMEPYQSLFPDAYRHLPNTSKVAERVIVLPTGTSVESSDCRRIGEFMISRLMSYGI